ncbi:gluconate 2-dehydrogenase subunit 3 family protein [Frigidibacter albus]|uniref:Gluconate 2-dehydrogenase subunit 3 family protein n=1 Tax=Frigidibacter albus TaxID=1465486 RepID=A0A6L8VKB2_9RHOB|nr:gluconate 2-dehydrogenase subunit 3 family protein [Frigidibacter albus]MZQ90815.1 gluconate 2-dehydrogenase subunit 3 family protein [Frigidibacter albus]NBE32567.1 gluconate 2-dehydrogenase subunit 3 family protein [Frigidibacter albus]GGH61281.1 exported protein [Frigidibacter albus]
MPLPDWKTTRRGFLGGGAGAAALTAMAVPLHAQSPEPEPLENYAPEYFTAEEWQFVMSATALLIPSGPTPGAIEARVPVFIDLQLASGFGSADDWYMAGPHIADADPLLGWQSPLTPAEIYREGIAAVNAWCEQTHEAPFADLLPQTQQEVMTALSEDEVPLPPELRGLFDLLLQNTKEGFFADPKYGGNHRMAGWTHIGFPGARASFLEWVDKHNVPYPLGPVAISGERG